MEQELDGVLETTVTTTCTRNLQAISLPSQQYQLAPVDLGDGVMELPQLPRVSDLPRDGAPDPARKIYTEQDMVHWQNCQALSNIELIISRFAQAVRDKPNSASACYISDVCPSFLLFDTSRGIDGAL